MGPPLSGCVGGVPGALGLALVLRIEDRECHRFANLANLHQDFDGAVTELSISGHDGAIAPGAGDFEALAILGRVRVSCNFILIINP